MTDSTPHIAVALAAGDAVDQALVAALLSQADGLVITVSEYLSDPAAVIAAAVRADHDVWLLDHRLAADTDVLARLVGAGRPALVLVDGDDPALEDRLLAAGAWDCLSASRLTATQLARSIRRAIEHARQLRAVTETERALRSSELRYRSLVRNAVYGIFRTTVDGLVVEANPALAQMLGLPESELVGASILRFYRNVADRERLLAAYRSGGRVPPLEVEWQREDGTIIWVRLSGRGVYAGDGPLEGLEMLAEDVTEHRLLECQFRQAQKMEAIGRLAGGVAHDFNNLLTAMLGYTEMLRDQVPPDDPRRHEVDEIHRAAERGSALTRQLLTFSRKQVVRRQTLDLNAVVSGFDKMLRRLIGEHITLKTVAAGDLGAVRADHGQIEQVIMNLAINARDAMPDGGRLTIETANVELDAIYSRTHATVSPGRYVMLAVSDTGCGMSSDIRSHLFEPFFTTKEKGKGSGLGLATVYGIVQQHGAHIWVYSEPGRGSTFKLYFPRVDATEAVEPAPETPSDLPHGSETILVVEDEPAVRGLAREILERHGYRVLVANNGRDGLAVAQAFLGTIDLVVTDIVMPEMNGGELVRHLLWTRPQIRVLYISGYTDHTVLKGGTLDPWVSFLQKPFTPDGLVTYVRKILDGQPHGNGERRR